MQTEKTAAPLSLYARLITAGVPCDSWQSDLYFPVTPETTEILDAAARAGVVNRRNVTRFCSNITGKPTYDAPFCFDPFWKKGV